MIPLRNDAAGPPDVLLSGLTAPEAHRLREVPEGERRFDHYRRAVNLTSLNRLRWVMGLSLAKTLASKLKISVAQVYKRYGTTIETEQGPRKVLKVEKVRPGKDPLVAYWGGISLARDTRATLVDKLPPILNGRTELVERMLADICELCGSTVKVQMHHVRALKDLRRKGRAKPPAWMEVMAARRRKTLAVCAPCHVDIHAGRPLTHSATPAWYPSANYKTPESRMT